MQGYELQRCFHVKLGANPHPFHSNRNVSTNVISASLNQCTCGSAWRGLGMGKLACSRALSASNGTKGSLISTLERMVVARHCSGPFRGPDIYGGPDMLFHCSLSKVENGITSASSGCARQGRYTLVELQSF